MLLAKNVIDVGLSTNNLELIGFWQKEVGLRFDHVLPVRRGQKQYRHDAMGSVVKLNHHLAPLRDAPQSGYRELLIAKECIEEPLLLSDPDGNRVRFVPPGHDGVSKIAMRMGVRSLTRFRKFYVDVLGFSPEPYSTGLAIRIGSSLLLLEEDPGATLDPVRQARGWRYITLQVCEIGALHARLISDGAHEGFAPVTFGDVARISMILDPDGIGLNSRSAPR